MALGPTLTLIKDELRDYVREYLGVTDPEEIPAQEPYRVVTRTGSIAGWDDDIPASSSVALAADEILVSVYLEKAATGSYKKRFTPLYTRTGSQTWVTVALPEGESTGSSWSYVIVVLQPTTTPAA